MHQVNVPWDRVTETLDRGDLTYMSLVGLHDEGPGYALQLASVTAVYPSRVAGIQTLIR